MEKKTKKNESRFLDKDYCTQVFEDCVFEIEDSFDENHTEVDVKLGLKNLDENDKAAIKTFASDVLKVSFQNETIEDAVICLLYHFCESINWIYEWEISETFDGKVTISRKTFEWGYIPLFESPEDIDE